MSALLRMNRTAVVVWTGLMIATLVSWWLGTEEGGEPGAGASVATTAVIVVTFVKVRFVGRHFMEVRDAPLALRLILDVYVVLICAMLVVMYLMTA